MAQATLVSDDEFERVYRIQDGREITIKIDDDDYSVSYYEDGIIIGEDRDFVFTQDEDNPNRYLLSRMYVPIKNAGLGRATIEFFRELLGVSIYARPNDGVSRDDSSHLTEDAPPFVNKMIREGLLEDNRNF